MTTSDSWQAEADLLYQGRKYLEQLCATTRYRHLFPHGANLAILFRAYQELDRWRTVRRRVVEEQSKAQRRRDRRRLFRILKRLVRADALARDRRLRWHYPQPRPRPLRATPPPIVLEALHEVDADARAEIEALVRGRDAPASSSSSAAGSSRTAGRLERGLQQFRDALINASLAHPRQIPRLHPQYLHFVTSPAPVHRKHPIATMLLVKLPLQLMMTLILIFNLAYLAAYHFFNDERLGDFLGERISGLLDGDLSFGKIHWTPMLIVDLLTGQPTRLTAYDVAVWEGYKIDGRDRTRRTAYAEHLEVELVIHEIIPWNRLGIPGMVEIPWVLHFEEVENHGELWVDVRAYRNHHRNGEWMLSLVNAFDTYEDLDPPPELKKLSFRIDHAVLDGLVFHLDMEGRSGWGTRIEFAELTAALDFEGWAPIDGRPDQLPLRYDLDARGGTGDLVISPIVEQPIPIADLRRLELSSGMRYRPLGDMWVSGDADLGGSPSVFEGQLLDVFGELAFDFQLGTTDYGPMAALMFPPKPDEHGQPRSMIAAAGSPASLKVTGPVDDVVLQAVGQGLTIDLFPEPSWALDDVDVSLTLARDPRPEIWDELGLPGGEASLEQDELERAPGGDDLPEQPDDGQRWIVYLDTFRGTALDGDVRLHRRTGQDHIVLAEPGEPLLVSIYLEMLDVNLGRLVPDDPELAGMLSGRTKGGLQIHQVVIGDEGLDRVEAELQRVAITRTRGPEDDHLPRNLRADGEVIWDAEDGLDLRGVRIVVDGGQLRFSGGINAAFDELGPSHASVRVDDGEAFLRAFGMPRWFDTLAADFSASGPLASPRGAGSLDISGAGSGALAVDDIEAARLEFKQGTLTLRSPNVAMLGGRGPLSADLVLLGPSGKALADPRLRLGLRLEDINRPDILGSGIGAGNATIELIIDDGADKPVPLSQLHARGGAYAETLTLAGVDYRDAEASFAFTREGIEIDRMTLAYHRPVSPALFSSATVPIGRVELEGTIGFSEDPPLALEVRAANVPLSALAATLDAELPVRGQIKRGSRLGVTGSLRKPQIEGQLVLAQLGAAGVPLGGGTLQLSSKDVPHQLADPEHGRAATAAHRRVEIEGSLAGEPNQTGGEGSLDWRIDATVAFGGAPHNQIEAAVDLRFATLPFDTLLTHPSREQWRTQIVGGLHDLVVETRYCPSHEDGFPPLLEACAGVDPEDPRLLAGEPLRIDLHLAQLWYRGRESGPAVALGGDPCLERDTTCSLEPLEARLEGTQLSLARPWKLRSGGKHGPELAIDGTFDLSGTEEQTDLQADDHTPTLAAVARCVPGIPDNPSLPRGSTAATVSGALDFSALAPFLAPAGVRPDGRLDIDLDISGVITRPTVTGYVRLPADQPIALAVDDPAADGSRRARPIPVEVSKFDLRMAGGTVYLDGKITVFDQVLSFGEIKNRQSFIDIAGPCAGRYALGAAGSIDGALVRRMLPSMFETSAGAVDLRDLFLAGDIARFAGASAGAGAGGGEGDDERGPGFDPGDELFAVREPLFDIFGGTLSFDRKAVRLGVQEFGEVRIASGVVEFRQCTRARPCNPGTEQQRTRGVAIWAGGRRAALSHSRPSDALTLRLGDRGRADLWGEVMLADSFDELESITLAAATKTFPISLADNSGRTELEAELSSDRIKVVYDGANGRISGDLLVDRSAWLRDARQGVAVLSFADPNPAPPTQLPEFLRGLELDMTLRTAEPFRVDNNVAKRLEASADLRLDGTVGDPDLSGTIAVERGVVDIDILGGAYDVSRGRVIVKHDLAQSVVDLRATRQKQIKVNSQLLTLNLHLSGPLDAIQWECSAPGDTSGAVASTRGCVDYLIFDAGNTDIA
ncbi:MAG: translocation/assembly module TamB domain-containing protein, partial [Enhygromyxa sp.]